MSSKEREMPKKSVIAVLAVAGALLLSSIPMFAQAASGGSNTASDTDIKLLREDIRSERKRLVAANMPLTDTEATKFWPIYDQYAAEVTTLGDTRVALIKEYAQSYNTMTDAQANDLMNRSAAIDQQFSALLLKYVPIFEKVISAKKTAKWYQIDRRLDLLINLELAANIPMVDASK
jgi:hypothetical protein